MKKTKIIFLSSFIVLVLCLLLFAGTTFAWFSDSVTSNNNVIASGNLDIEVDYTLDGKTWANLDGAEDLFSNSLWEPGHTELVVLRVTNQGSLALKYSAQIKISSETLGKTKSGYDIKLSELIELGSIIHKADSNLLENAFKDKDSLDYYKSKFNKTSYLGKRSEDSGYIRKLEADEIDYVFIQVALPKGIETNHDGVHIPSITFGIDVVATQINSENDSFGSDYDQNVWVDGMPIDTIEEFLLAIKSGTYLRLTSDIILDSSNAKSIVVNEDKTITLDLNGYKLINPVVNAASLINHGTLTIVGDGSIENGINDKSYEDLEGNEISNASKTIENYGTLIISGGNIGTKDSAGSSVTNYGGKVTINGGTFASRSEEFRGAGYADYVFINNGGTMIINNAEVIEPTHGLFACYAGEIIVNGGDFTLSGTYACYVGYITDGKLTINDGNINVLTTRYGNYLYAYKDGRGYTKNAVTDNDFVNLLGGTYTGWDVTRYVDLGYVAIRKANGSYEIIPE